MSMLRLVWNGLRFHWRMHAGTAGGIALAAAILTGALLVGDSADYSLRTYALARLGSIHYAIESRSGFFSEAYVTGLREQMPARAVPVLTLPGMALAGDGSDTRQINQANVIGISPEFEELEPNAAVSPGEHEAALNERLAEALGVQTGDHVALRILKPGLLPRDAPLSSRAGDSTVRALCTISAVLPDTGLGRFSLSPAQTAPYNAFVNLDWLQTLLELEGRINLTLVGEGVEQAALEDAMKTAWRPEQVGLTLRTHTGGVIQLETDRIYLRPAVAEAALSLPGARGTLSYLVNSISCGPRSTPYSFATAGPVPDDMRDDQVVINRWLADTLNAKPGDEVVVRYFEFTSSNQFVERSRTFSVHSIVEMPELAMERDLMPQFPGLTDVERCEDWDIGMPLDQDQLSDEANEAYWNDFGPTPKFLCTLAAGQAMWGNRYGDLMAVRLNAGLTSESAIIDALCRRVTPGEAGLTLLPVRQQAFDAVEQAIDLGGLFLGMSFFLIVAALILTALLFVFGVQHRAGEMGVLLALGFRPLQVRLLFLFESSASALAGALIGAAAGTLYTRGLIFGLSHYWQGAVAHTRILYHAAPGSLLAGGGASLLCALAAIGLAMWRQTNHAPRDLLTMDFSQETLSVMTRRRHVPDWLLPLASFVVALALIGSALNSESPNVALIFFTAGAFLLVAGVGAFRWFLRRMSSPDSIQRLTFRSLAFENAARRRGRSLSVAALLATGAFLILAVSSMRMDVTANADKRSSGTGGFELYAETTLPLPENPSNTFRTEDTAIVALRVREGDDASCLNLNRAQSPRLLGVNPDELAALRAFLPEGTQDDLWPLLTIELHDGAVPALVGDSDTALWGLQKKTGIENGDVLIYRDDDGNEVTVRLVGRLPMRVSVFQGSILISDAWFTRLFPSEAGFRAFLVDTPPDRADAIAAALNKTFEREGMDAEPAPQRLLRFYAVESTYLAMFLVLGGLGMVLGSAALGIVVLRNLFERRSEIAMLRAVGFDQQA
ncbi:MAG TPA: FtsX-like permease family protein, partial [Candidatus Hydrogenedentes bacterium]|nr:FtsX-like permease family protein [Candidatus Hydrogenedentota bacterium]